MHVHVQVDILWNRWRPKGGVLAMALAKIYLYWLVVEQHAGRQITTQSLSTTTPSAPINQVETGGEPLYDNSWPSITWTATYTAHISHTTWDSCSASLPVGNWRNLPDQSQKRTHGSLRGPQGWSKWTSCHIAVARLWTSWSEMIKRVLGTFIRGIQNKFNPWWRHLKRDIMAGERRLLPLAAHVCNHTPSMVVPW